MATTSALAKEQGAGNEQGRGSRDTGMQMATEATATVIRIMIPTSYVRKDGDNREMTRTPCCSFDTTYDGGNVLDTVFSDIAVAEAVVTEAL